MDLYSFKDEIINYKNKYGNKKTIEKYEERLLNIRNLDLLIWFYDNVDGVDINKIIDLVISTRKVYLMKNLALYCKDAIGKKLSEAIVKYGDSEDIYYCASMELGDLDVLTDGIIQKGTADDMEEFAFGIEDVDVARLVFEACRFDYLNGYTKSSRMLRLLDNMRDWSENDLYFKRLESLIIQSKNVCLMSDYIDVCIENRKKINFVSEFENAVLDSNDVIFMLEFAESSFVTDVKKLITRIIDIIVNEFENSGKIMLVNYPYLHSLYSLALKVKADNISALEDLVYEHASPKSIQTLAVYAYDTPFEKKALTALLKTNDLQQIHWYRINTMIHESDNPIEKEIVDIVYNHPIRHFAIIMDMPDASFEEIEDAVINSGFLDLIYDFAIRVKGANISKLEDAIIKAGNVEYILRFAQNVNGANTSKLEDAIIDNYEHSVGSHLITFASSVEGADIRKLEDAVIKIGNIDAIVRFASKVPLANLERLQDYVLDYGSGYDIYNFASSVKGADIYKLEDALFNMSDIYIMIEFASNVLFVNITKLEDALISNNDLNGIVLFAKDVSKANINKLEDAIIKSNDGEYIFRFAKDVERADIDKLIPEIFNLEYEDGICRLLCEVSYDYNLLMENFIMNGNIDTVCTVISYLYMNNESAKKIGGEGKKIDDLDYYVTLLNKRATLDNIEIENSDGEFYVVNELSEEDKILRLSKRF